jgi:hypothetical protein
MTGRPATYKTSMVEIARRYIANHEDFDDPVPTVAGLACVLGVTRETCYAWSKDESKPEFSDILRELAQRQERILVRGGLKGDFNAPISKMMLTKHGYSDKVENDHTSSDGTMSPKPALDTSKLSTEAMAEIMRAADASRSDDD